MNPALLPAEPLAATPPVGSGPALNGEVIARLAGSGAAETSVAVGQSGPADAQALDRKAAAPHAYKAEWAHYAARCAQAGNRPAFGRSSGRGLLPHQPGQEPRAQHDPPAAVGVGKMHRDNDLPWNPLHSAIQEPLQAVLRTRDRPVQKPAAVSSGRDSAFGLSVEGRSPSAICRLGADPNRTPQDPDRARMHQSPAADRRRDLRLGVRERRPRITGARGGTACV
jgi:hypothetical protein